MSSFYHTPGQLLDTAIVARIQNRAGRSSSQFLSLIGLDDYTIIGRTMTAISGLVSLNELVVFNTPPPPPTTTTTDTTTTTTIVPPQEPSSSNQASTTLCEDPSAGSPELLRRRSVVSHDHTYATRPNKHRKRLNTGTQEGPPGEGDPDNNNSRHDSSGSGPSEDVGPSNSCPKRGRGKGTSTKNQSKGGSTNGSGGTTGTGGSTSVLGMDTEPPPPPEFSFARPNEAPVFTPTEEEFKDPLAYINKIRPYAEHAGICKIRPPPKWQPPFAVDVDNFKFTPRVQRLNELEAKTRIKLNFLDRIAKFWELQGTSLKIPLIDKKPLDLYNLHQLVKSDGGRDKINTEKKWNSIATRLGYDKSRNLGGILKSHYEKFLYPFDLFEASKDKLIQDKSSPLKGSPKKTYPMKVTPGGRMGGKVKTPVLVDDRPLTPACPNELKRLAFYGAGPKMAGFNSKSSQNLQLRMTPDEEQTVVQSHFGVDPLSKYVCRICARGDAENQMLLCDGCDDSYHTFCLKPPLTDIPKGEWRCPKCVADEVSKPSEAFGFEQAAREYTLQQFGEMADQFKSEYFNMPVHVVPSKQIENEFWRIVSAIDEDVTVEYGADLHTMDHGSGFPTAGPPGKWSLEDEKYVHSGWNLNNLPILVGSVLGHINTDISGMMVPWMYVGMCFSTFCWHNEDHWSYSINYLHWGEPKTWYGVPGARADEFEDAMKSAAPELFHSQPDLLHQLVTIMNPNILMTAGVPVYRTDQQAGEFVVTFPRAYHAGFNQGYNLAEAVNFAPADWIPAGRSCVDHYSHLHRYCVFSHDELICKMAAKADDLDLMIAVATYKDFTKMYETEKEYRRQILSWGVTQCERVAFELIPDDSKLCEFCKTTCFLSAITCECDRDHLVCLKHFDKLCGCPSEKHILKFRYTLDEIPDMMKRLKERADEYESWQAALRDGMNPEAVEKMDLEDLESILEEAKAKQFPMTPTYESALEVKKHADKCVTVARRLTSPAIRTRTRAPLPDDSKFQITLKELELFDDELGTLPIRIREWSQIRILLERLKVFKAKADELLGMDSPPINDLRDCKELAVGFDSKIKLPEVGKLGDLLERTKWLDQVKGPLEVVEEEEQSLTVWTIGFVNGCIDSGDKLAKYPKVEKYLKVLKTMRNSYDSWETKAQDVLHNLDNATLDVLNDLVLESKQIRIHLPTLSSVRDFIRKTTDWMDKARRFRNQQEYLYLDELEEFIEVENLGPWVAKEMKNLRCHATEANEFRIRAANLFLRTNPQIQLVEAFLPRRDISQFPRRGVILRRKKGNPPLSRQEFADLAGVLYQDLKDTPSLFRALRVREDEEIRKMRELRRVNVGKRTSGHEDTERYCVCQSTWASGMMIQCHLCLEHYHATCIILEKDLVPTPVGVSSIAMTVYQILARNIRYFCPRCRLSRRPSLDCLVEFLTYLQNMVVRVPEGEGIEFLTQRAMRWVDRARDFLAQDEVSDALELSEPVGVIKPQDLSDGPPKSYLARTQSKDWVAVWHPDSGATVRFDTVDETKVIGGIAGMKLWNDQLQLFIGRSSLDLRFGTEQVDGKNTWNWGNCSTSQGIESPPSTSTLMSMGQPVKKNRTKSFLLNRDAGEETVIRGPTIWLSPNVLAELEDLLMEGDLIEVSMPETVQLYRIRELTQPPQPIMHISIIEEAIRAEIEFKQIPSNGKAVVERRGEIGSDGQEQPRLRRRSSNGDQVKSQVKVEPRRRCNSGDSENKQLRKRKRQAAAYETCGATKCKKPTGKLDWVQCEFGCDLWFHFVCVGLKKGDIQKIQRYCCNACGFKREQSEDPGEEGEMKVTEEEVFRSRADWTFGDDLGSLVPVQVKKEP